MRSGGLKTSWLNATQEYESLMDSSCEESGSESDVDSNHKFSLNITSSDDNCEYNYLSCKHGV